MNNIAIKRNHLLMYLNTQLSIPWYGKIPTYSYFNTCTTSSNSTVFTYAKNYAVYFIPIPRGARKITLSGTINYGRFGYCCDNIGNNVNSIGEYAFLTNTILTSTPITLKSGYNYFCFSCLKTSSTLENYIFS